MTGRSRVLLLEDDEVLSGLLARVLRACGCVVDSLEACEELPHADELGRYDLVLADVNLAGKLTGFDALRAVRKVAPWVPVVLMTAMADVDDAVRAMNEGAHDYLPKPIDPNELKAKVRDVLARKAVRETGDVAAPDSLRAASAKIVGRSHAMVEVYKTVAQVARTKATVLVVGESGSGKELVARKIHEESPRAKAQFVAVNCAAISESLLESELFGYEKGAFTGAAAMRRGLFEEADGGTLFLDEIGEITPKMQAQLLRVLQEGEVRRVGGSEPVPVDVRVVAATNRDLEALVRRGEFRQDLYFRLNVVNIRVPPLRERRDDIPALVHHFVAKHAERLERDKPRVADDALELLKRYDFPGNVRELSHVIERALLFAKEGVVTAHNLPDELFRPPQRIVDRALDVSDLPTVAELTRRYVEHVLSRVAGNKTRAAEILGLNRRTLSRMFAGEVRPGEAEAAPEDAEAKR